MIADVRVQSAVLFILPWLDRSPVRSCKFRPVYKWFFWVLLIACIALGWAGQEAAEGVPLFVSRIATAYYFFHFLILLPLLGVMERPKPLPASISEPVLKGGGALAGAAAKPMEKA